MSKNNKNEKIGFIYLFFAIFTWATVELTFKLVQGSASPLNTNFFRMLFGGITIIIFIFRSKGSSTFINYIKLYPKYYIPASIIGLVFGMLIYLTGTSMTLASYSATIFSSNPLIISTIMMLFLGEKQTKKKILGVIIGFFGMILMITELNFADFFAEENLIGNFYVFIGMLLWSIFVVIGKMQMNHAVEKELSDGNESENFNAITMIIAALSMLPFILLSGDFEVITSYTIDIWLGLLYLGIVTAGLGYVLFFKGISMMEASKGINIFYLKPILATILSFFILLEIPTIYLFIGLVFEVIALLLVASD
ncbi:MAG: DMT family transporter [archaeon]|nr:DMT family transporter [archaeon]